MLCLIRKVCDFMYVALFLLDSLGKKYYEKRCTVTFFILLTHPENSQVLNIRKAFSHSALPIAFMDNCFL